MQLEMFELEVVGGEYDQRRPDGDDVPVIQIGGGGPEKAPRRPRKARHEPPPKTLEERRAEVAAWLLSEAVRWRRRAEAAEAKLRELGVKFPE